MDHHIDDVEQTVLTSQWQNGAHICLGYRPLYCCQTGTLGHREESTDKGAYTVAIQTFTPEYHRSCSLRKVSCFTGVRILKLCQALYLSCVVFHFATLAVMADGLQQQVDEHSQLLRLATGQESQDDGGPGGSTGLPLEPTACFTAQTPKQDPVSQTANTGW